MKLYTIASKAFNALSSYGLTDEISFSNHGCNSYLISWYSGTGGRYECAIKRDGKRYTLTIGDRDSHHTSLNGALYRAVHMLVAYGCSYTIGK